MSGPSRRRSNPKGELSEDQINKINEAFAVFDTEKNGKMPSKDLKVCQKCNFSLKFIIFFIIDIYFIAGNESSGL